MPNQVLYGFVTLQDIFSQRVSDAGTDLIDRAIQQSVDEHNRQINALMSLFIDRTTKAQARYQTPAAARLQPMDDFGNALPIKRAGFYDLAWPLQQGAAAWGQNYRASKKLTVKEANDLTSTLLTADMRWVRDHILGALYTNVSWVFADEEFGNLTVKGPANGDTDIYLQQVGADLGATDTHFFAQAGLVADITNPFPNIYNELAEHPENGGEVIVFVPTDDKAACEALTGFYPVADPNVKLGAAQAQLVGDLGVPLPGRMFGYVDKCWLVHWPVLPAHYLIGITTDGDKPVRMREEPETELQGFNRVAQEAKHPFYKSEWLRIAGFGANNRVGAVVTRVGNGAYAIPTGYTAPIP